MQDQILAMDDAFTTPESKRLIHLRISDHAWATLMRIAADHQWMFENAKSAKGLSRFIASAVLTPTQEWVDMRPDYLKDASQVRLNAAFDRQRRRYSHREVPTVPLWWDPDEILVARPQRMLTMREDAIAAIRVEATKRMMCDPRAHVFRFNMTSSISAFLEAWGRGMIVPLHMPNNPTPSLIRHREPPKEMVW